MAAAQFKQPRPLHWHHVFHECAQRSGQKEMDSSAQNKLFLQGIDHESAYLIGGCIETSETIKLVEPIENECIFLVLFDLMNSWKTAELSHLLCSRAKAATLRCVE